MKDFAARRPALACAGVIAWLVVLVVITARLKPFWHDEIYTILEADLPIATLWRASIDGLDLSPPLNSIVTRGIQRMAGVGPIVTRLPAGTGFLGALVVLFVMVRRRANTGIALAAMLALGLSVARPYAIEARGYGLTVGLFAVALYAWTEAAADRHRTRNWTLMAVALAAGVWTHYYFVLVALPIVAGEIVRQRGLRRVDLAAWASLAGAAIATLPLATLATRASASSATFWARPRTLDLRAIYTFLLNDISPTVAIVIGTLTAVQFLVRTRGRDWPRRLPAHEATAGLVCLLLPALAATLGYAIKVFDPRYSVFTSFGLALAAPLLVWTLLPANGGLDWVLALVFATLMALLTATKLGGPPFWKPAYADRPALQDWLKSPPPIAIACDVDYLQLWYYAPESARARAIYLADPESQLRLTFTDTLDRGYLALARWTTVPAMPLADFIRTNRHFWLYSCGSPWINRRLKSVNATLTFHGREPNGSAAIYEVKIP